MLLMVVEDVSRVVGQGMIANGAIKTDVAVGDMILVKKANGRELSITIGGIHKGILETFANAKAGDRVGLFLDSGALGFSDICAGDEIYI